MRHLGVLAPLSGTAFAYYGRALDAEVKRRLGPGHSAQLMAAAFDEANELLAQEKWWTLTQRLKGYVRDLARGGVKGVIMCSLTWYRFFDDLVEGLPIPLFHPVDALAHEMERRGAERGPIGLLAPWLAVYPGPLLDRFTASICRQVILPSDADLRLLDQICGQAAGGAYTRHKAHSDMLRVIDSLRAGGAQSIVAGCAELADILEPDDYARDCYNLSEIHAKAAAEWMLAENSEARPPS